MGGEFGITGRAKGSKARTTHSITKGKSLRGTKGGEFKRRQGRGRPREKKPALPNVKDIGTLDDITNLYTL